MPGGAGTWKEAPTSPAGTRRRNQLGKTSEATCCVIPSFEKAESNRGDRVPPWWPGLGHWWDDRGPFAVAGMSPIVTVVWAAWVCTLVALRGC